MLGILFQFSNTSAPYFIKSLKKLGKNASAKIWQAEGCAAGLHVDFLQDEMSQLSDTSVLSFAGHIQVVSIFMYQ